MPHEVIMPALGMAQDTGLLVAWCKAPGDKVEAGDILFEVETDKSTMEVEAGQDGYLAELRAEAGENVPVGDVIAVITGDRPDAPAQRAIAGMDHPAAARETANEVPADAPADEAAFLTAPQPHTPAAARHSPLQPYGRILASPKAKRLAAERGYDLSRLLAAGVEQPYHVADLAKLRTQPATAGPAAAAAMSMHLSASVPAEGFDAFRVWLAAEADAPVPTATILAAFLTGALRAGRDDPVESLAIAVEMPAADRTLYSDADVVGIGDLLPSDDGKPVLLLRDLTAMRLDGVRLGTATTPVLTITRKGGELVIAFEAEQNAFSSDIAICLVSEFAARLETPLRQLL